MADSKDREGDDREARALPYPTSRLAPRYDLVDAAREIQKADAAIGAVVGAKLTVILDQVRALQEQARQVLEEARRSLELHRATCSFKKVPGRVYHLYRRGDELYFSMLSPADWNGEPPHAYEGSYRLENDMTWSPADRSRECPDVEHVLAQLEGVGRTGRDPGTTG